MSIGFEVIEDSIVIIRQKTIYKQVKAYDRNGDIYAKACGGFVRLAVSGGTSHPDIKWLEIERSKILKPKPYKAGYLEAEK
jgi:hypothetical protein